MRTRFQGRCLALGLSLIGIALAAILLCGCPPKPPEPEKIKVDVCFETMKLANEFCPEHGLREFVRGQEPKEVCAVHQKPPDPQPRVRVWVGVYDHQVAEGDWRAFLRKVKEGKGWGVRVFADCQWKWQGTMPFEYAAFDEATAERIRRKDPQDPKDIEDDGGVMTLVRESGRRFPLFDYSRPRAEYWNHLRDVCEYCREIGLEVWIVMLDFCTLKSPGDDKYFSPWYCAVQRMLPGIENGTWGEQMKPWIAAFYQQVWGVVQASGVGYLVEDMNEGDALGWGDAFMVEWFKWSNATLKGMGIPKEKIVTTVGRNAEAIAPLCGLFSPHGIGRPDQIKPTAGMAIDLTIFSSDGFWGGGPDCDAAGKCSFGADAAAALGEKVHEAGSGKFEWLPRHVYSRNRNRANLDDFNPAILRALAGTIQ